MECSVSPAPTAMAVAPAAALPVTPGGLAAAFAAVPDPRRQASIDYTLPAILTLAVAAILSAHQSVLAIAEWGARQERELLAWLGFPEGRTPCQSTVQRLFRKLAGHALAAASRPTSPRPWRPPRWSRGRRGWRSTARRSAGACSTRRAAARATP